MLLKECPMCGCKEMIEIHEIGYKCVNCDEVFKYDNQFGFTTVSLEEWVDYLNDQNNHASGALNKAT